MTVVAPTRVTPRRAADTPDPAEGQAAVNQGSPSPGRSHPARDPGHGRSPRALVVLIGRDEAFSADEDRRPRTVDGDPQIDSWCSPNF